MSESLGMGPPGISVLLKFLRGFQYALRSRTIQAERMPRTNLEAEDPLAEGQLGGQRVSGAAGVPGGGEACGEITIGKAGRAIGYGSLETRIQDWEPWRGSESCDPTVIWKWLI